MPTIFKPTQNLINEDLNDLVTSVPHWVTRTGITIIFIILTLIITSTFVVKFPDIINTTIRINSTNLPKSILARKNSKLVSVLVKENQLVKQGQPLAYYESIGNARDIIDLRNKIFKLKRGENINIDSLISTTINLGEIQPSFDLFKERAFIVHSSKGNGYYAQKKLRLQKDLDLLNRQNSFIKKMMSDQDKELKNQEEEYRAYQKLYKNKVISRSEFLLQENKFYSSKYPTQQSEIAIIESVKTYKNKEAELQDFQHIMVEQKVAYEKSLNQLITDINLWIQEYVIASPIDGKVNFAGTVQKNQNFTTNQEIFIIEPANSSFFGEIYIPQFNMGKIEKGKSVIVKLKSYPYEQYGSLKGNLYYISNVAYRDSVFYGKVSFDAKIANEKKITLKNGMTGDAEIITKETNLFSKLIRNIIRNRN